MILGLKMQYHKLKEKTHSPHVIPPIKIKDRLNLIPIGFRMEP